MRFEKPDAPYYTITAIVETARRDRVIEDPKAQFYLPVGEALGDETRAHPLIVQADPGAKPLVIGEIRQAIRRAFPAATPVVRQMTGLLEPQYRPWRLGATLFTIFGVLALVVAAVGIYSTISYGVSQRVHELGIRIALGARTGDILRHVIGGGLRTVAVGVAAGVVLSLAAGRLVAALLFGVQPNDVRVLGLVSATLVAVAVLAALAPAWRAARVDPAIALRAE